jgi:hypothetical protein
MLFLLRLKTDLLNFNRELDNLEKNLIFSLKQIPLNILLIALEIQKYKYKYQTIQVQVKKIRKLIIISQYIYKLYQRKFS